MLPRELTKKEANKPKAVYQCAKQFFRLYKASKNKSTADAHRGQALCLFQKAARLGSQPAKTFLFKYRKSGESTLSPRIVRDGIAVSRQKNAFSPQR